MWGRKYSFDTVNHQPSCPIWSKMCSLMTKVATRRQTDWLVVGFLVFTWDSCRVIIPTSSWWRQNCNSYFNRTPKVSSFIIRSVGNWWFAWLLIDTIVDWTFGDQDSWVAPVRRSPFRAIVVRFLVLFPDVMFSYNSKMIVLVCILREDQIWWLGSKFDSAFWAALKYRFVLFSFNVIITITYWLFYNDNGN